MQSYRLVCLLATVAFFTSCSTSPQAKRDVLPKTPAWATSIDELVLAHIKEKNIASINVLIEHKGKVYKKAYGQAVSGEKPTQARADMVYRVGSVTKVFTAAAVLKLVHQGKLSLDAPIQKYLPTYPKKNDIITVRHLLNHSSGIKSYTSSSKFIGSMDKDFSHPEILAMFQELPLVFPPGKGFQYSNSGYYLLGLIIESVTKKSYEQALTDIVLKPLNLKHTTYCPQAYRKNDAHGYRRGTKTLKPSQPVSLKPPYSAGALCSVPQDILKLQQGLKGTFLSPSLRSAFWKSGKLNSGAALHYQFGVFFGESGGHQTEGHGGAIPGFHARWSHYPNTQLSLVMLSNTESASLFSLEEKVRRALLGPDRIDKGPKVDLADAVGTYILPGTMKLAVYPSDGVYKLRINGTTVFTLQAKHTDFVAKEAPSIRVRFTPSQHVTLFRQGYMTTIPFKGKMVSKSAVAPKPQPLDKAKAKALAGRYESVIGVMVIGEKDGVLTATFSPKPTLKPQPTLTLRHTGKLTFYPEGLWHIKLHFEHDANKPPTLTLHQGGNSFKFLRK